MEAITTSSLINMLKKNKSSFIESAMDNGQFRATHFLIFRGKKIYDTGIDSQEIRRTPAEFLSLYPKTFWTIDQIID